MHQNEIKLVLCEEESNFTIPFLTKGRKTDPNSIELNLPLMHEYIDKPSATTAKSKRNGCINISVSGCKILGTSNIFLLEEYQDMVELIPGSMKKGNCCRNPWNILLMLDNILVQKYFKP